mmetsp:Transcript_17600/g.22832  ORF Transcript_17600/g.22832 Transcript_17600/m.22832 type:complete len:374 (-) Transcript_17600:213-1334(-)|eukprot:CAMPEP_0198152852 /NCGR_PEP_ID=MMETSP1443-20131203/61518_1 /TAXON_ID=186043 /ORGANISM="Entomoneis sp., Strain CCMP2396" /LENGTH=373 /DNA_ID=CAMNT_0043818985 /DNA_START=9 /DNA_END=1130 /DNA_ORIENTATION=+
MTTKKCLVIGGGFGGLTAITGLRNKDKDVEIVLVEPKEYFECVWAAYRSPFDQKTRDGSHFDLVAFCKSKKVTHIKSVVTALQAQEATLANGDTISFDVAVVAVGAQTPWQGLGRSIPENTMTTLEDRKAQMVQAGDKILTADSVVIVGGGLIGVELAGDAAFFKAQQGKPVDVTLVHSHERLCQEMNEKGSGMVYKKLEALGVKIVLNDKVNVDDETGKLTLTTSGEELKADEVVMTVGFSPINKLLDASMLNDKGWVEVDDFFRVKGSGGNIFAIGDCCSLLPNSGNQVMGNAKVMGANLKAALQGETNVSKFKKFAASPTMICATTGAKAGVFYTDFLTTQRIFPGIKNSTMFFMSPKQTFGIKNFVAEK